MLDEACANCIWRDQKAQCSKNAANAKEREEAENVQIAKDMKAAEGKRQGRSDKRMAASGKATGLAEGLQSDRGMLHKKK